MKHPVKLKGDQYRAFICLGPLGLPRPDEGYVLLPDRMVTLKLAGTSYDMMKWCLSIREDVVELLNEMKLYDWNAVYTYDSSLQDPNPDLYGTVLNIEATEDEILLFKLSLNS